MGETMQIPNTTVENSHITSTPYPRGGFPEVIGMGLVQGGTLHPDRVLDFWVLGILIRGTMALQIGSEQVTLSAEHYYLLPPHVHHAGLERAATFDVIYFHFTTSPTPEEPSTFFLSLIGRVPPELSYLNLYRFIKRAADFALLPPAGINLQLAAILAQLHVMQGYISGEGERSKRLAYRVMDYLREHIEREVSATQLAADLGYSYGHLDRVFRQHFATSIHQKLLHLRVDAARELLLQGKPLKQIASRVCFHDYRYFLKVFKRMYGTSPVELQRNQVVPHREDRNSSSSKHW
jgi:AraC-like DNA-binding protein